MVCYAILRDTARRSAYPLRKFAAGLWKFLRLGDSHDYARRRDFRFDIAVPPKRVHPALECADIEARFPFDFAIADRRAAQDSPDVALLVRLPKNQPAIEPHGRAHSLVMAGFEKHAAQSRVIVFASHHLAAERSANSVSALRRNWSRLSIRRS